MRRLIVSFLFYSKSFFQFINFFVILKNFELMKIKKKKLFLVLLTFGLLSPISKTFGQSEKFSIESNNEALNIYFGETLPSELLKGMGKENVVIQISDDKGNIVKKLNVVEFKNYPMTNPGMFNVHVHSDHIPNIADNECNHELHDKDYKVIVLPYRLNFDMSAIQFSRNLIGGVDMQNSYLTIPIEFLSASNESIKLSDFKLIGSGVNNTIVGTLSDKDLILNPGTNLLTFQLSGSVQTGTYVMFDFLDPTGRTVCYYYPNQIK